jgi:hypothetical protein
MAMFLDFGESPSGRIASAITGERRQKELVIAAKSSDQIVMFRGVSGPDYWILEASTCDGQGLPTEFSTLSWNGSQGLAETREITWETMRDAKGTLLPLPTSYIVRKNQSTSLRAYFADLLEPVSLPVDLSELSICYSYHRVNHSAVERSNDVTLQDLSNETGLPLCLIERSPAADDLATSLRETWQPGAKVYFPTNDPTGPPYEKWDREIQSFFQSTITPVSLQDIELPGSIIRRLTMPTGGDHLISVRHFNP